MFLSLSFPLRLSLKSINISSGEDLKKNKIKIKQCPITPISTDLKKKKDIFLAHVIVHLTHCAFTYWRKMRNALFRARVLIKTLRLF